MKITAIEKMITGYTTSVNIYKTIQTACFSFSADTKYFNKTFDRIHTYALYNQQLDGLKDGDKNGIRFPAVFIAFPDDNFIDLSRGYQQINGTFVAFIAMQSLIHEDEKILEFKDKLSTHLRHELPKLGMRDVTRIFQTQDTAYDKSICVWQVEFRYAWVDNDNADEKYHKTVDPFSIEYNVTYEQ